MYLAVLIYPSLCLQSVSRPFPPPELIIDFPPCRFASHVKRMSKAIHWAIVLNVIVVGMGGHNIGQKRAEVLSDMEAVLTIIFTVEASLKIMVLGARRYFKSRWDEEIAACSENGLCCPGEHCLELSLT